MRRTSSEVIRNLESRIANLENKTASSMEAYPYYGDEAGTMKPIKCELNARSIASCIKKEFGCDVDQSSITLLVGNKHNDTMILVSCRPNQYDLTDIYIYLKNGREYPLF